MNIFKRLLRKSVSKHVFTKQQADTEIIEAFKFGGVQYYQFYDFFSAPSERTFSAISFFEEMRMRCTREFLLAHLKAREAIMSDTKGIDISKMSKMDTQLAERLEWIIEPYTFLKFCSVVYFDKHENPFKYNHKYNVKKIQKWKDAGVDFFLLPATRNLLPFMNLSEKDLQVYLMTVEKMTQAHLDTISMMLSEKDKKSDFYRKLLSQAT